MQTSLDIAIPAGVFFIMFVVGMDLTVEDFRRVVHNRKVVPISTLGLMRGSEP